MNLIGIDQNLWLKTYPAIAANAALLLFAVFKKPRLKTYLLVFSATTLADILVASKIIPIANPDVQTAIEYIFVLIGDLRFIVLLAFVVYAQKKMPEIEAFKIDGPVWKPALVFTMFDSLIVRAIEFANPGIFTEPRVKFLTYEGIFFALTFLWIFAVMPQKPIADAERRERELSDGHAEFRFDTFQIELTAINRLHQFIDAFAISLLRRDDDAFGFADLHADQRLIETGDDFARADRERQWLATFGRIEHIAIIELACVMNFHGVAALNCGH